MTIEKPLILIVDDQKINREILKGILNEDYRCIEAVNGEEAWKALENNSDIAAVLLDLVMIWEGVSLAMIPSIMRAEQ